MFAPAVVGTARAKFPEIVAVGFPELTLIKANLAEAVDCPPTRRSTVELFGKSAPEP